MLQLLTRDGARMGNAILTEVSYCEKAKDFIFQLETDFGNVASLTYSELVSLFKFGVPMDYARWSSDRELAIANIDQDAFGFSGVNLQPTDEFSKYLRSLMAELTSPEPQEKVEPQPEDPMNFAYGRNHGEILKELTAAASKIGIDLTKYAVIMLNRGENIRDADVVAQIDEQLNNIHDLLPHEKAAVVLFDDNYHPDDREKIRSAITSESCDHLEVLPVFMSSSKPR